MKQRDAEKHQAEQDELEWDAERSDHGPRITSPFAQVCPAAAPLGTRRTERDQLRIVHGEAQVAIYLPGLRIGPAPVAGAMPRLRRVEYACPGERRGVEHLCCQAQFA